MTYAYICPKCDTENIGDFTPGRPAPACSNPDSPAFSDDGDPAEWDGPKRCETCKFKFNLDIVIEKASNYFNL